MRRGKKEREDPKDELTIHAKYRGQGQEKGKEEKGRKKKGRRKKG
jgi:hypothetical protein